MKNATKDGNGLSYTLLSRRVIHNVTKHAEIQVLFCQQKVEFLEALRARLVLISH